MSLFTKPELSLRQVAVDGKKGRQFSLIAIRVFIPQGVEFDVPQGATVLYEKVENGQKFSNTVLIFTVVGGVECTASTFIKLLEDERYTLPVLAQYHQSIRTLFGNMQEIVRRKYERKPEKLQALTGLLEYKL